MGPAEGDSGGNFGRQPPLLPAIRILPGGAFPPLAYPGGLAPPWLAPITGWPIAGYGAHNRWLALNIAHGRPLGARPGPTEPPEPIPRHLGRQRGMGVPAAK